MSGVTEKLESRESTRRLVFRKILYHYIALLATGDVVTHDGRSQVALPKGLRPRLEQLAALFLRGTLDQKASQLFKVQFDKLAGSQLERINYYIDQADIDYRDVLAMAEYPGEMRQPYSLKENDPERYAQIVEADREQYERWIESHVKKRF